MDDPGKVRRIAAEQMCQGQLGNRLLIGPPGVFNSGEAVVHIIDSTFEIIRSRKRAASR